jgi:hypothetical protein
MNCCGEDRVTRFCPECGKGLVPGCRRARLSLSPEDVAAYVDRTLSAEELAAKNRCHVGTVYQLLRRGGHKRKLRDLSGPIPGTRLTALRPTLRRSKGGYAYWLCRCACGNECEVARANLMKGRLKSCGCQRREYYQEMRDGKRCPARKSVG